MTGDHKRSSPDSVTRTHSATAACSKWRQSRRNVLGVIGGVALIAPLAGCLDGDNGDNGSNNGDVDDDPLDMGAIENHLADANGWEGELQDHRGEETLTIEVGDPDGGNNYQFDPIAPEIDVGTEVTWEWIDGSSHSVTALDQSFDSGVQAEYTFDYTIDAVGTILYECQPHRAVGHLGALVVYE